MLVKILWRIFVALNLLTGMLVGCIIEKEFPVKLMAKAMSHSNELADYILAKMLNNEQIVSDDVEEFITSL